MKFLFLFLTALALNCYAEDAPVCKKCQVIREYNAAHPENNYYWYDDYLKENNLDKNGQKINGAKETVTEQKDTKGLLTGCKRCRDRDREEPVYDPTV